MQIILEPNGNVLNSAWIFLTISEKQLSHKANRILFYDLIFLARETIFQIFVIFIYQFLEIRCFKY